MTHAYSRIPGSTLYESVRNPPVESLNGLKLKLQFNIYILPNSVPEATDQNQNICTQNSAKLSLLFDENSADISWNYQNEQQFIINQIMEQTKKTNIGRLSCYYCVLTKKVN